MLGFLLKHLPEREAPRNTAIAVVIAGTVLATLFAVLSESFVDEAIRIAPYTPAVLAAVIFGGRSAGFASLLLNTALVSALLNQDDPGRTLGTFFFQMAFGAATLLAGDALRVAAHQLIQRQAELEARESTLSALVGELDHRAKNMISVVQLLSRQTAASSEGLQDFQPAFQDRLAALGRAQSLLIRARWAQVALADIAHATLEPFTTTGGEAGLQILGLLPDDGEPAMVEGGCAVALALTLHELATNAAKHGALSSPAGRAIISWAWDEPGRLVLSWVERGGPPVSPPTRRGFGTRLMSRMLEPYGDPRFAFDPEGLCFEFVFAAVQDPPNPSYAGTLTVP